MGRRSKFEESFKQRIIDLYLAGCTDVQVARALGITRATLHNWRSKYADQEFLDTIKEAKEFADDLVEASIFHRAIGYVGTEIKTVFYRGEWFTKRVEKIYPPETLAGIFWLKNRQPERWAGRELEEPNPTIEISSKRKFKEFCSIAGYPEPFPKQEEMRLFGSEENCIRLLLGSRGYGKTDYVTGLGTAYEIYLNAKHTTLIVTKSKARNTAIISEIANALEKNGIALEKRNSTEVRVAGLVGKDSNVSATTIKSVSLRGRHPHRVIMDDPVTPEDVSDATRRAAKRCYNEVVKLTENVLVIGQPVHKFDLFEEIRPIVKKMEVPFGSIPELDPDLEAQRLAGVDEASISASYFLKILAEGQTPFDKVKYVDRFSEGGSSVAFIDPSFEGGDYTALTIMKAYMEGVQVVGFVYKKAWNHALDEIAPRLSHFGVQRLCFETNSLGDQPLEILRSVFPCGVVGRKSNGNKHSRIMAAGTFAHMIHLSKQSDKLYLDHVTQYEYKAKFDDAPDSLASCLAWIGLIRGKQ